MRALVNVPETAARDEIVEIKVLIRHPMETGFRTDRQGALVPRDIIPLLWCTYGGEEVFRAKIFPAVAANPFFSFTLRAEATGEVIIHWVDQAGGEHSETRTLTVS